jgi:hypothetical protein
MKNFILLICAIFFSIGCEKRINCNRVLSRNIQLVGNIEFNDEVNKFILEFMNSLKNPNCIYEIYIDKKTENEYLLTLFSEPDTPDYLSNHLPVNYTIIDGKYVFIYSGLEDFIKKESFEPKVKIKRVINEDNIESSTISMVISKDTTYIAGDIGLPFTNIKFNPPVIYKTPP